MTNGITQWTHRQFNSEKIRHSERYRRHVLNRKSICSFASCLSKSSTRPHSVVFIPDALFLRKYLTLIEEIINSHKSLIKVQDFKLILLESAAEYMDYRNSSPCIVHKNTTSKNYNKEESTLVKESPSINERNRIIKLCIDHKRHMAYTGLEVIPFPDLTLKNNDQLGNDFDDDFNVFGYMEMNIQDRSKCAIARAAKYFFHSTLSDLESSTLVIQDRDQCQIDIIILSDDNIYDNIDVGNLNNTVTIKCMDCNELVKFITNLYDNEKEEMTIVEDNWVKLQTRCEDEYHYRNKPNNTDINDSYQKDKFGHFEYLHIDELERGITQKKFFKAKLKVTSENCREAYCSIKGEGGQTQTIKYFLNENNGNFNRAIHDDNVIIEPLPKSKWEQPIGRSWLTQMHNDQEDDNGKHSFNVHNYQSGDSSIMPTAQVVGLYKDSYQIRRQFIATLVTKPSEIHRDNAIIVVPMDPKIPKIRIKTRIDYQRIVNKRLLVEIDSWALDSMYPTGHYIKTIGEVGDLNTEINCLMIERNINLSPFSANALACLPQVPNEDKWVVSEEEIKQRRDLRKSYRIFSVDPQGCQDIDDAMHAKVLETGDIEVGVHIADVTQFVKLHSALDIEASKRGTTFYLVDRRFDMLPPLLSSNLCSLHGNTDRYAVSVIWTLSPDLEQVKSTWYGRTVIHNVQAMTYEQAHNILHDKEPDNPNKFPPPLTAGAPVDRSLIKDLKNDLTILTVLARKLRHRRETVGGAVDLSSGDRGSELKFVLDSDGRPTNVTPKKELEIHHTIAELMIMSNAFVAETIYKNFPDSSILRIHQKANVDSFEELEKLLIANGISFDGTSNKSLAKTLKEAAAANNTLQNSLFQSLAVRAMSEAQYICTGALEEGAQLSHYGLGIEMYCHFTSPIRRYADIAVHHLLLASLSKKETLDRSLSKTSTNVNFLPSSNAISILGGDGLGKREVTINVTSDDNLNDDFLDSLIEGTSDLVLNDAKKKLTEVTINHEPYSTTELSRICDNLNTQNRSAKTTSMDCQRLFLSLFFKNKTEVAEAIVVDLRRNGLIVYIPKFDIKGPLYLADRNGCVQINPTIMNLPASSGLPPTTGFTTLDGCRMLPDGKCSTFDLNDISKAKVEVSVPGCPKKLSFKYLDVITVQVSCDFSNTTARIPSPTFYLISQHYNPRASLGMINDESKTNYIIPEEEKKEEDIERNDESQSIFKILSSIELKPVVDAPIRWEAKTKRAEFKERVQTIQGRMCFGGYKNAESKYNDYHSFEIHNRMALEDYAKQGNYDASKRIERDATSRIQRKAAEKRNARRAKRS